MVQEVGQSKGRIDSVYFAPQLAKENHNLRKPNPGMAQLAKKEFPEIDLSSSIMVGDSISDMGFGENAGMQNVYIHSEKVDKLDQIPCLMQFDSLYDFSQFLSECK